MVKQTPAGLQIRVRLTPRAARDGINGWMRDENGAPVLKAAVTAVPERGRANAALIALLSRSWKIPKSAIILSQGGADRNKTLILIGLSALPAAAPPLPPS